MSDDVDDAFVPIRDEDGRVTGAMDRTTAAFLASTAPDPSQDSLDALLRTVTRVRVIPFANLVYGATELRTLLDTSDPDSLAAFRRCFAINEDPATFGHCMCCGDPHVELYAGGQLVATLGYHHGLSIRWSAWKSDAFLKEPELLLDWLSAHGVDGPRREVEAARHRDEESRRNAERWLEATPACLRPFWEQMGNTHDPAVHCSLLEALSGDIPEADEQVLTLFGWYGSGVGLWSGYPAYESMPERLLLYYPIDTLVAVLERSAPTEAQWRGAARFFGDFYRVKKKDRKLLSMQLKQRLLEAARSTGLADTIKRAERAFGK